MNFDMKLRYASTVNLFPAECFHALIMLDKEEDAADREFHMMTPLVQSRVVSRVSKAFDPRLDIGNLFRDYLYWRSGADAAPDERVGNRYVYNSIHLMSTMDVMFPRPDTYTVYYLYRVYLWLAFMGFSEQEALYIRKDEVDIRTMTIRENRIPSEAVQDILSLMKLTEYVDFGNINGAVRTSEISESDMLLARKKSDESKTDDAFVLTVLRSSVQHGAARAGAYKSDHPDSAVASDVTFKRVFCSGLFYRAAEKESVLGHDYASRLFDGKALKKVYAEWKKLYR